MSNDVRFPPLASAAMHEAPAVNPTEARASAVRAVRLAARDLLRAVTLEARTRAVLAREGTKVAPLHADEAGLLAVLLALSGGRPS